MVYATLESPIADCPELEVPRPSVLQQRFLHVINSVGPLVRLLEERSARHPQIGDFEVPLVSEWRPIVPGKGEVIEEDMARLTMHGLLLGERMMPYRVGGRKQMGLPPLQARQIAGHLVTSDTIYAHRGFRYDTPEGIIMCDRLTDLVPHGSVDLLPDQARATLDGIVTEAEHVAMRLSIAYGIGADLPVFNGHIL